MVFFVELARIPRFIKLIIGNMVKKYR